MPRRHRRVRPTYREDADSQRAAPVCYIDYPMVADDHVFHGRTLAHGIEHWLKMVAQHGVRVVLIDTAKKSDGRRLLKEEPEDKGGMLLLDEVRRLDAYARKLGIKALWAGGILLPQTFELGRLWVFDVYVNFGRLRCN